MIPKMIETLIKDLVFIIADGNPYQRRLIRSLLIGAKAIREIADGIEALNAIRTLLPDVVLLDWDLPVLDAAHVLKLVRSPDAFPCASVPIIVLSSYPDHRSVRRALQLGAHEFMAKPLSPKALFDRVATIVTQPRPMVMIGDHYVPRPRFDPSMRESQPVTTPR